jgi:hypothetical protein
MRGKLAKPTDRRDPAQLAEHVRITSAMALELLEQDMDADEAINRPLQRQHVERIARQIAAGKWRFNGDTIKISTDGRVLDGQHRLWAVVESKGTIDTLIVRDVARDAFATIDTLRKPRTGADILGLYGLERYRRDTATALTWLIRWQGGVLTHYKTASNRVENSDIEAAFAAHPDMPGAVERVRRLKGLLTPALAGFLYYVMASRDMDLAERFVDTLESPAGVSVSDPFYQFRIWLSNSLDRKDRREPLVVIALAFKAWNAAREGREVAHLFWRNQGPSAEAFPSLSD